MVDACMISFTDCSICVAVWLSDLVLIMLIDCLRLYVRLVDCCGLVI